MADTNGDPIAADPTPYLLHLAGSTCGGHALRAWIADEYSPLCDEHDPRVLHPDVVRSLLPLVIHRYAVLSKQDRADPIAVLRLALAAATGKARMALIEATVKSVDALIIKPTNGGKASYSVPLASILYADQFVVECIKVLGESTPAKLFAIHCNLVGMALHHPDAARTSTTGAGVSVTKFVNVFVGTKFLWKSAAGRQLAPKVAQWVLADQLGQDLTVVHGALAELARVLVAGLAQWDEKWTEVVLKHLVLCKLAAPKSVFHKLAPLLKHLSSSTVFATAEKALLRAPEVILPFLTAYLPAVAAATASSQQPLTITDSIATSIANQLISSNENNALLARSVFASLWTAVAASDPKSQAVLTAKALATIPRCPSWQVKLDVYQSLRPPAVRLSAADVDQVAKLVKTETNDTVATCAFEVLAHYPEQASTVLATAWVRVTEKIRKPVLAAWLDAGNVVPADKLAAAVDHVALAHVLRAGAFDAKRDAKKVTALTAVKSSAGVDKYFVYAVSDLIALDGAATVLTDAQAEHAMALILASPHAVHMSAALMSHPRFYAVLAKVLSAVPSPTAQFALPLATSPTARKQYLALLHHIKSEHALLPLLLFAHHPAIPEDTWAALAFHAKVHHLDQWLHSRAKEAQEIVRQGLFSDAEWERLAALRAAATLVWIDGELVTPMVELAVKLVNDTRESERLAEEAEERAAELAVSAPSPVSAGGKGNKRPGSAGGAGAKKGGAAAAAAPAVVEVPKVVNHIPLALSLLRSVTAHNSSLDAVISPIMGVLQSMTDFQNSDLVATWTAVCKCLDESISSVHETLATLLVTLPPLGSDAKVDMTASLDDLISSVMFQVTMKTQQEPMSPVTFVVVYEVLERVIELARKRTRTTDKSVLNRILDHIAFTIDIFAQNATLAVSPLFPVSAVMRTVLNMMRIWRKQTQAKAHEALVTLCHANPDTTMDQLDILLSECEVNAGMEHVIAACLEALLYVKKPAGMDEWPRRMHVLVHVLGAHPEYVDLAKAVVDKHQLHVEVDAVEELLVLSETAALASCAAAFLTDLLARDPEASKAMADSLLTSITKRCKAAAHIPQLKDEFGMPIKVEKDTVTPRLGLLECLGALAPHLSGSAGPLKTWVPQLDDPSPEVRHHLLGALRAYAQAHSNKEFIPVLQSYANHKSDDVREAVVVLTGECAAHLSGSDPKLREIVQLLVDALRTPSESVQIAVAKCLAQLPVDPKGLAQRLLDTMLFAESKYGVQRGAAYGVAGLAAEHRELFVQLNMIELIKEKLGSKDVSARQGGLLLLECCTLSAGRLFEPWLIIITPALLNLFSDTNTAVREATIDTARIMMKNISTHAVKLLMPTLMRGLESDAWRTKKASVELLSSMAYCSSDKLSATLPVLIPAMLEAMGDSHLQVSKAAKDALGTFSSVITTPEIEVMVSMLMDALVQGGNKTLPALQALCVTTFEHYLDPPALALVAPVVLQGLLGRSADMKCLAAQILGNLTSLTAPKDLLHYSPKFMPALLQVVADTVPKTRSIACRTLGVLVRNLGYAQFPSLVSELFAVLDNANSSAVEKSGAAQGLSEVLAALGKDHLDKWMPTILEGLNSGRRDGYLVLLVFLPSTFGNQYTDYITQTLPAVLAGLSDESELVRDSALRAAQILIEMFNAKAIDLLMPELIRGVYDPSWRIRQSSVQLLGDMLARIMGQRVKKSAKLGNDYSGEDGADKDGSGSDSDSDSESDDDEQQHVQTHTQQIKQLVETLGLEMYHRTLSSLYILRADASGQVRQTANNVWRMLVSNTPRQLKEILPVLLSIILEYLAREPVSAAGDGSDSDDDALVEVDELEEIVNTVQQTLVDIVRKLGDSILGQLLPLLKKSLQETPRGACMALIHIMKATGRQGTTEHRDEVTAIVSWALKHPSEEVRGAGAAAFDELLHQTGTSCIDAVLLPMLKDLPDSLSGLQHVMSVRGHVVLPVLLPSLLAKVDEASCTALASLLSVSSLGRKTAGVLESLLAQYNEHVSPALKALLSHEVDEDDLGDLSDVLEDARESCIYGVAQAIGSLAPHATQYYRVQWLAWLLVEINTDDAALVPVLYESMDSLVKSIPKDELESYVSTVANALAKHFNTIKASSSTSEDGTEIAPLSVFAQHPRGPAPALAIVLHTLMYGAHKEQAVRALILIITLTPGANLRAHVTGMTGPLIRILGDRVTGIVKALILEAITLLLKRVALMLKPFIPQLSRTLVKQLDTDDVKVLAKAQDALITLLGLHPRPDALLAELAGLVSGGDRELQAVQTIAAILTAGVAFAKDPAPLQAAAEAVQAAGAGPQAAKLAKAAQAKFP